MAKADHVSGPLYACGSALAGIMDVAGLWGCGVAHIGLYLDPLADPGAFLASVVRQGPILLLAQWAIPPAETTMWFQFKEMHFWGHVHWLAAMAFIAVLSVLLRPFLRVDRIARFWALGMLLSLLPICATAATDRLLLFVGLGAMGLLARFLVFAHRIGKDRPGHGAWPRAILLSTIVLIGLHLVLAPVALFVRSAMPFGPKGYLDHYLVTVPDEASIVEQDLVVINAPSTFGTLYTPVIRDLADWPIPRHLRVLAPGCPGLTVYRLDESTLVVRPDQGFGHLILDALFRNKAHPMKVGQQVELTGMTVEIMAMTADDRPAEASFRFAVPLEHGSLRWLQWKDGGFVPFELPSIGNAVELRIGRTALF
ncbi:MAG: hypothetical protein GXY44_16340 [Phycisphaerales bacterium]|nr:hypothetical protein [Phycisphaerales bacterium]